MTSGCDYPLLTDREDDIVKNVVKNGSAIER